MKRAALLVASASMALACDPVHSNEVDALGGEASGVRTGPTHRPGQPCLVCHDGNIGDPPRFNVAGTVFVTPYVVAPENGAGGAIVKMTDATGASHASTTNEVGNFYVTPNEWTPVYPITVEIDYGGVTTTMKSHIGRDGSCAGCHRNPAGPSSPGPVAVGWGDGGVP